MERETGIEREGEGGGDNIIEDAPIKSDINKKNLNRTRLYTANQKLLADTFRRVSPNNGCCAAASYMMAAHPHRQLQTTRAEMAVTSAALGGVVS